MLRPHGHSAAEIAARLASRNDSGRLRDAIFGGIDGTVTTFAIVAGVQGAGLSAGIVVALGLANVVADGFSMAAGNYAGTKAIADDRKRLWTIEEDHIRTNPQGELDELDQILANKGLHGEVRQKAGDMISADKNQWITMMLAEEYGLPATDPQPMRAAIVIFAAFVVAGLLPLLPYLFGVASPFAWSIAAAAVTFFAIGTIKSQWSLAAWWASGFETLMIGGTAAALAYAVGRLFHT